MKHFRRIVLIALFPTLLIVLCFLVNCTSEPWVDDGNRYLCPECKDSPFLQLGDICERCGAGTDVNPLKYCYDWDIGGQVWTLDKSYALQREG